MTDEQHNKYIAYTFLAYGGFQLLMTAVMMGFFYFFFTGQPGPRPPETFVTFIIGFLAVIQLTFTAPSFIAAYAMLKQKPWARIAGIAGGVVSAMSVPFGTAAAIYSLWFFFSDNWKNVYGEAQGSNSSPALIEGGDNTAWQRANADNFQFDASKYAEPPDWR